ncbi:MAG: dienelactone hydrolase family protein [Polyangiaceae bacterium]|nr:dienelactone hydrolase family protein [Polyangiaceae bacterium]
MRFGSRVIQVALLAVALLAPSVARAEPPLAPEGHGVLPASTSGEVLDREVAPPTPWCHAELEALPNDVCYAKGPTSKSGKRTLVIFLHGLVEQGTDWQHSLQRGMKAAGKRLDFSLLAPRGRTKVGPGKSESTVAWPSRDRTLEDEVIGEWLAAQKLIEKREGAPFDEVFVMGFSNGAYYASSLALRGRLEVDGYGVFAGGSAPKGTVSASKGTKTRKPLFLAIASKDETAKKGKELAKALKELKWPHRVASAPVGHVVADSQLEQGLAYLRGRAEKAAQESDEPKPTAAKSKSKSKKTATAPKHKKKSSKDKTKKPKKKA